MSALCIHSSLIMGLLSLCDTLLMRRQHQVGSIKSGSKVGGWVQWSLITCVGHGAMGIYLIMVSQKICHRYEI